MGVGLTALSEAQAREVAEGLLDKTGAALKANEFDSFAECFAIPFEMETLEGQKLLDTPEAVRHVFDSVVEYYRKQGMTELVRVVVDAQSPHSDEVQSIHHSLILSGQILTQGSFHCFSQIKRFGDDWKITQTKYTITDKPDHVAALLGDPVK